MKQIHFAITAALAVTITLCSTIAFAQKPTIEQKNYYWDQDFHASISDKGGFVLTQGDTGLYIYNTATAKSAFYPKAFNAHISPDEKWIAFQQPGNSLRLLNTANNQFTQLDSTTGFQLLNQPNRLIIQKSNGALYYFNGANTQLINPSSINKYLSNKTGTHLYYYNQEGYLLRYQFSSRKEDTLLHIDNITDIKRNEATNDIFVLAQQPSGNDLIVLRANHAPVHINQLIPATLDIIDYSLQIEQPTGRIYFRAIKKKTPPAPTQPATPMQVWNYEDPYLYPMMINEQRDSTYYFTYNPATNQLTDLGGNTLDYWPINPATTNHWLIGLSILNPYERFWLPKARSSCYVINTFTGQQKEVYHQMEGFYGMFDQLQFDPQQKKLLYYDITLRNFRVYDPATGAEKLLNPDSSIVLDDLDDDPRGSPAPYGIAGWSADGQFVYLYDKYDIWQFHLEGKQPPRCVTRQEGRKANRNLRIVNPTGNEDEKMILTGNERLLLSSFDHTTKDNGFYELNLNTNSTRELLMTAHTYWNRRSANPGTAPIRSRNCNTWLFQRMSATEFPNFFTTKNFKKITPVTSFQPQNEYNWMNAQRIKAGDTDGILYTPKNFDPNKKYPLIFYIYEKFTDGINHFIYPMLSDGTLNIPWYTSNGYLVFLPDINHRNNEPGPSALRTVENARHYFSNQPYIDSTAFGIQGHSFGGYQVNYIVTHSNGFAAACAASGASNLFTSYSNIRGGAQPGQVDFERGQFKIKQPVWDIPNTYLENSPISSTSRVTTPLLLVSNKQDSAVLWSHGIEMFTALRRQQKPCWLLQYDRSNHTLAWEDRADFSIRLQQFFDHYLKHQPEPAWMKQQTSPSDRSVFPSIK